MIYEPGFEPIGHIYKDDNGNVVDGTTDMISKELGLPSGKWLEPYATRGSYVDEACELYDNHDLNMDNCGMVVIKGSPCYVKDYIEQYKLALAYHKIKVLQNKIKRYSPLYGIAGELDKVCLIDNCVWVVDLKTTVKQFAHHKWQTAVYLELIKDELTEKYPGMPQKRGCLYLTPISFELVEHAEENNFCEFRALHAAIKIKIANGYARKRTQVEWDL